MTKEQSKRLDEMTLRLEQFKRKGLITENEAQRLWFIEYCKIVRGRTPKTASTVLVGGEQREHDCKRSAEDGCVGCVNNL